MYKSEENKDKELPLVSIIIYMSSKEALFKNIREFTRQTYDNVEIIIVANESSKKAKKLLSNVLQNYPKKGRIKIVEFERNFDSNVEPAGKNEAFLFGARHANGDYFLFADEKTFWNNTFVEGAVTMLEEEEADLATSDCAILWKNGDCYLHSLKLDVNKDVTPFNQFMLSSGMLYGLSSMSNKFIRRDLWKRSTDIIEKTYNESVGLSFFCNDLVFSSIIVLNASKIVHKENNYFVNIWKNEDAVISEYAGSKSIDKIVKELEIAFKLLKRLCANIIDEKMFAHIQNNLLSVFIWRINWAVPDIKSKLEETFGEIDADYNLGEAFKGRISSVDAESLFTETNNSSSFGFKIQNILFPKNEIEINSSRDMFSRGQPLFYNNIEETWTLEHGICECFSYFNSLSVEKWDTFTNATAYNLHLLVKGKFRIEIFGHWLESESQSATGINTLLNEIRSLDIPDIKKRDIIHETILKSKTGKETMTSLIIDNEVAREVVIPIEYEKSTIIGFVIKAITPVIIYDGYYTAEISEERLNTVDIAICTTTFKKEEYIKSNIELLKEEIFEGNGNNGCDKLKNHLYILVVDNGRTLKESEINSDRIKLFANPNTGGAGGFSRGMLETMNLAKNGDFNATHVLFMDDDIEIMPESLKRTYSLLALVKDEYKDYFISGAMMNLEQRNMQFENLGFISESANVWGSAKPRFDLNIYHNVLRNECDFTINDNMYGAWWYCVVPMKFIDEKNLSLPIFYRTDDIEFSLRHKAKFITLNGIGLWHLPFWAKENEALDYYLSIRNTLIMQATSGVAQKADFAGRIKNLYKVEICKFNYTACEHLLDALDDYMKGPEFIQKLNGEEKLKSQTKKNLKLVPSTVFGITDEELGSAYNYVPLQTEDMSIFESTDNGHTLPDFLLDDTDAPVIAQMFFESPGKQFRKKHIRLVSAVNKKGALLTMDKERYANIKRRYDELMEKYANEKEKITAEYREQSAKLHSADFWREYLGLNGS